MSQNSGKIVWYFVSRLNDSLKIILGLRGQAGISIRDAKPGKESLRKAQAEYKEAARCVEQEMKKRTVSCYVTENVHF